MRTVALLIALLLSTANYAQLLKTKREIIREYGTDFTSGVAKEGYTYLIYESLMKTKASGWYKQFKLFGFKNIDYEDVCFMVMLLEPLSEINNNIKMLDSKYVKIGELKWKDYANDVIYRIEIKEDFCVTIGMIDF